MKARFILTIIPKCLYNLLYKGIFCTSHYDYCLMMKETKS